MSLLEELNINVNDELSQSRDTNQNLDMLSVSSKVYSNDPSILNEIGRSLTHDVRVRFFEALRSDREKVENGEWSLGDPRDIGDSANSSIIAHAGIFDLSQFPDKIKESVAEAISGNALSPIENRNSPEGREMYADGHGGGINPDLSIFSPEEILKVTEIFQEKMERIYGGSFQPEIIELAKSKMSARITEMRDEDRDRIPETANVFGELSNNLNRALETAGTRKDIGSLDVSLDRRQEIMSDVIYENFLLSPLNTALASAHTRERADALAQANASLDVIDRALTKVGLPSDVGKMRAVMKDVFDNAKFDHPDHEAFAESLRKLRFPNQNQDLSNDAMVSEMMSKIIDERQSSTERLDPNVIV